MARLKRPYDSMFGDEQDMYPEGDPSSMFGASPQEPPPPPTTPEEPPPIEIDWGGGDPPWWQDYKPKQPYLGQDLDPVDTPSPRYTGQDAFPGGKPAGTTPAAGYDYEKLRDYLFSQGKGLRTRADLERLLAARPDLSQGVSIAGRGDLIRLPGGPRSREGDLIDVIGNMGDPNLAGAAWATAQGPNSPEPNWPSGGPAPGGGGPRGPSAGGGRQEPAEQVGLGFLPPAPSPRAFDPARLRTTLEGFFPDGAFNQDVVNRRVESARGSMERERRSRLATQQARLAERGLTGSGPEITGMNLLEGDLYGRMAGEMGEIYGEEGQRADTRMMQALQMSAGLTADESRLILDTFRTQQEGQLAGRGMDIQERLGLGDLDLRRQLGFGDMDLRRQLGMGELDLQRLLGLGSQDITRMLGLGGLALGDVGQTNQYNLGLGRLNLDRELGLAGLRNLDINRIIELLQQLYGGAGQSAGGYF